MQCHKVFTEGFCRKVFDWLENSFRWTQLCCEGGELLECGEAGLA